MDDLLREFLTESSESISLLDVDLVKLEQSPDDPRLLGEIFRLVHTVKGTCGFLNLPRLEAVAHSAENVLGKIRDGELPVTPEAISLILESVDQIKELLAGLEANEAEPEGNDSDLIARLDVLAGDSASVDEEPAAPAQDDGGAAGQNLYELIKGRGLIAYRDEGFRRAISQSVAIESTRGWRIGKATGSHKVDLTVALAMACLAAVREGPSVEITADMLGTCGESAMAQVAERAKLAGNREAMMWSEPIEKPWERDSRNAAIPRPIIIC